MVFLMTSVLRLLLHGSSSIVLENAALRHQLAVLQRSAGQPRLTPKDRRFWGSLSKHWSEWEDALVLVQPATVIGTNRRECLDQFIAFGENHLREVLKEYVAYYNSSRTQLGLDGDCSDGREAEHEGRVYAIPWLGGLHHTYRRNAG